MLARSFKSAAELGILETDYDALIKTLFAFERGEIQNKQFDMHEWCGTACCIWGHTRQFQKDAFDGLFSEMPFGLRLLFVPSAMEMPLNVFYENIKPQHAAIAISNFLTIGEPRWSEALA